MDTVINAVDFLELHETPYWSIQSGSTKVGESKTTDNMADSIARFRQSVNMLPAGNYKVVGTKNPNDNRGGVTFPFTKGQQAANASAMQQGTAGLSTNAYGIADHVLKQIQEETRRTLLFEQMHQQFGPMAKLVEDLERRLTKVEKFLKEDEDGDGIPDFLDMAKKAGDTVKAVGDVKSVFADGWLS